MCWCAAPVIGCGGAEKSSQTSAKVHAGVGVVGENEEGAAVVAFSCMVRLIPYLPSSAAKLQFSSLRRRQDPVSWEHQFSGSDGIDRTNG